jgi:thiol-disulfide isomerase/thioredoxin|tara:strand:- start:84 stop:719 length:636 start_codon:yes stop_codon:yes gene_type:complete
MGKEPWNDFKSTKSEKYPDGYPPDTELEFSPWYYFFSEGCAWCKRTTPIVEELNDEGYDILILDLVEPENQKLQEELHEEYSNVCGSPWFINADTGNNFCGYRDKDTVKRWLQGEEIPELPVAKTDPPKPPTSASATDEEIEMWGEEMRQWQEENNHLTNLQPIDTMIQNVKHRRDQLKHPVATISPQDVERRLSSLEHKIDRLIAHLGVR